MEKIMQKIFASRFHKIDNLTNPEIDKWTKDYLVCIEDETLEASEFLPIFFSIVIIPRIELGPWN